MNEIMDGKALAQKIRIQIKDDVAILKQEGILPKLAIILVGNDEASKIYVRNKSKACYEVGIEYEEHVLSENSTIHDLINLIEELNNRNDITGILLQSPIPEPLDIRTAFQAIDPKKDVDGFHPINIGLLELNQAPFIACTPLGIMKLLEEYNIPIEGAHVVLIGKSNIVGRPLMQCLLNKGATVTITHSKTRHLKEITKQADVLITAVGKPQFITKDMIKMGAVVIDVGINRDKTTGEIVGDVKYNEVSPKASYITPVPGGVGPMTIAMLMYNVAIAAKQRKEGKL